MHRIRSTTGNIGRRHTRNRGDQGLSHAGGKLDSGLCRFRPACSGASNGNQRHYNRSALRRIPIIRIAQRAGSSQALIKEHLDKMPNTSISTKEWRDLSQEWHTMLDERITMLMQLRDKMAGCIGCGCLSLNDCPLRNPDDMLAEQGPGPQRLIDPQPEQITD